MTFFIKRNRTFSSISKNHVLLFWPKKEYHYHGGGLHWKMFPKGAHFFHSIFVNPVPAGIRRPTITFSFKPWSLSTLPFIAASVSTRVVSWKDAAEINELVCNDALVIPNKILSAIIVFFPSFCGIFCYFFTLQVDFWDYFFY